MRWLIRCLSCLLVFAATTAAPGQDASPQAILQMFEATWETVERRTPDMFLAGYGGIWLPPTGRADSGNQSVGYDVYDRFDLGRPGSPTLYGTEAGLKAAVAGFQRSGGSVYVDLIWNHNGFRDASTGGFLDQGGYPGFLLTHPDAIDGDFWGRFESGQYRERLAGLISINHGTNFRYIRNPVPGFDNNLPGGSVANIPSEDNRRFYPDRSLDPIIVFDPATGESGIHIYRFNRDNPAAGDPVEENALGYLMRNAQWLVQEIGVDGFRLDATKHVEPWVFNFYDRAVYRSSLRPHLDGSQRHVFSFGEAYTGDMAEIQQYIRKDIDPGDPGRVGGNRDALDFPLFFALGGNLTPNGAANNWHNVVSASQSIYDNGRANDGSAGVAFVQSHDDHGPYLNNVAHAFTLMRPGNAIVYFNAREFGNGRDFPKDGRGDALGGVFGDTITTLVNLRNTHGRGNYIERWINEDYLAFEREGAAVVLLSNRDDGGTSGSERIYVNLPYGTHLVEMTGNHVHDGAVAEVLTVTNDFFDGPTYINARFLNNAGQDRGYLVYGLPTPQGTLSVSNVAQVLQGATPTPENNGTARLGDVHVITDDEFDLSLETIPVRLLGLDSLRDRDADGDAALFKFNDGLDLNGNGYVDHVTPGSVVYGFEEFTSVRNPGYFAADGHGLYVQQIDASQLPEGYNYVTVRAFRHRGDGGVPVFTDFRKVIYIDRLPPESAVESFEPWTGGTSGNRDLIVRSVDQTADNIHVFLNLAAAVSDEDVLAMVGEGNRAGRWDRDLWKYAFFDLEHGNHAVTVVTYEITGNFNIQRFTGLFTETDRGAGLGDLTLDGRFEGDDLDLMYAAVLSNDTIFHAAGDFTGDGRNTLDDWWLLGDKLQAIFASGELRDDGWPLVSQGTLDYYHFLSVTVPEPTTLLLLAFGGLAMLNRRSRG
jgi:alpha-amylase